MSVFSDRVLMRLADPADLAAVLAPAGAPPPARLSLLASSVHELGSARIERIDEVRVRDVVLQRPLFPVHRQTGSWTGVVPTHSRADLVLDHATTGTPVWVDLLGTVVLRAVLETDPAGVESITTEEITAFATLEEFRARFHWLDLDAFMDERGLETVDDVRRAAHYLRTELRLATPPPFDPDDEANRHDIEVPVAVLVRDELDLTETLRDARLVRTLAPANPSSDPDGAFGERTAAWAMAAVFPSTALPAGGPPEADVHRLFAREGVLSLFLAPA